jgi:ubiquinone/menaquinone biosynthesis C-methylase UbiE
VHHAGVALPPPELRAGGEHFQDDDAFWTSGKAEADRLRQRFGLARTTSMLEVGCGAGRLAIGLRAEVGPMERYVGIDVSPEVIRWCRQYIERDVPTMRFVQMDTQNSRYRPDGRALSKDDRLPVASQSIDVVYLYSVFSHMRADDVRWYLHEFRRVLAPSGAVFLTAFIEDDVERESVNPAGYGSRQWQGPLHCVRFSRMYFEQLVREAGLQFDEVEHGTETDGQSAIYLRVATP